MTVPRDASPERGLDDPELTELVRLAYRGVLRREVAADDLELALGRLTRGEIAPNDLLRELLASEEYGRTRVAPRYDWRSDPRLTRFLSDEVVRFSARLQGERPLSREAFEAAWAERFERELGHSEVEEGHRAYGEEHERRFWELVNALPAMLGARPEWRLLDFGLSVFTAMYGKLFPAARLFVSDRPVEGDHLEFFERECRKAGVERLFRNDLNDPAFLTDSVLEEMGTFDAIVLTEVLEHLTTHPVHVLRQVARLLRPDGHLYVTTPNFFSVHHLREVDRRINPQHPFPLAGNDDAHYHYREYALAELLEAFEPSGLRVTGFYFSDCWEAPDLAAELEHRPDERSNLVVTAALPSPGTGGPA